MSIDLILLYIITITGLLDLVLTLGDFILTYKTHQYEKTKYKKREKAGARRSNAAVYRMEK